MKYIKYALVITLCVLSFYASDRLILYVENLSPLMKEIKMYEDSLYESPVNAIIEDNTIITGKKGRELNKRESYLKMNDFGSIKSMNNKYTIILILFMYIFICFMIKCTNFFFVGTYA